MALERNVVILTSSGGGGLLQAANAKEQELRAKNPEISIARVDVLKDWMGKRFGEFCARKWNRAQIQGNVRELHFLIASQVCFDWMGWGYFFFRALHLFFREEVDLVIDTQPIATAPVLKALRIYNWWRRKEVVLQKVVVDLPTKAATHFFRSIRRLGAKDRSFLRLITIAPLLEEGETAEEFWQKTCRLSDKEICYEDVYVRQSFLKYKNQKRNKDPFSIHIRYKGEEELHLMKKSFCLGGPMATIEPGKVLFSIPPEAWVMTILLGSQPASGATFFYVKNLIEAVKTQEFFQRLSFLFVFCAEHHSNLPTLFRTISDFIAGVKNYPPILTIIPFSFQKDDVIAPLFFRSDATCTRSGGQTAMELMCVSSGKICIHSEATCDDEEALLQGIPGWEAANALYLKKFFNARIVTPQTFLSHMH